MSRKPLFAEKLPLSGLQGLESLTQIQETGTSFDLLIDVFLIGGKNAGKTKAMGHIQQTLGALRCNDAQLHPDEVSSLEILSRELDRDGYDPPGTPGDLVRHYVLQGKAKDIVRDIGLAQQSMTAALPLALNASTLGLGFAPIFTGFYFGLPWGLGCALACLPVLLLARRLRPRTAPRPGITGNFECVLWDIPGENMDQSGGPSKVEAFTRALVKKRRETWRGHYAALPVVVLNPLAFSGNRAKVEAQQVCTFAVHVSRGVAFEANVQYPDPLLIVSRARLLDFLRSLEDAPDRVWVLPWNEHQPPHAGQISPVAIDRGMIEEIVGNPDQLIQEDQVRIRTIEYDAAESADTKAVGTWAEIDQGYRSFFRQPAPDPATYVIYRHQVGLRKFSDENASEFVDWIFHRIMEPPETAPSPLENNTGPVGGGPLPSPSESPTIQNEALPSDAFPRG